MRASWLLSASAGILAALASPGFNLDFLIWVSLIPLFFALDGQTAGKSFSLAYAAGLAFFGVLLYWIFTLSEWAGGLILPAFLLLIGYLSLYWGVFGLVYSFFRRRLGSAWGVVAAPAVWITFEFAKAQGIFGFTWGDLGYALYQRPELIQIASIAGVWGVSFVIVAVNSVLFLAVKRTLEAGSVRVGVPYLLGAFVILGVLLASGRLAMASQDKAFAESLRVAIVQSSVDQRQKRDARFAHEIMESYKRLLNSIEREVDLVVLPESLTLFGFPLHDQTLLAPFVQLAQAKRAYVLLGVIDRRDEKYYNSAALLSPQGEVLGVYDKVHLVPFGEFLPLRGVWQRLGLADLIEEAVPGDYTPGRSFYPLKAGWGPIATLISFESIFPYIAREFTRQGAELLVALTNEAWYKGSYALPQHWAMGVFRAVENRRFFLQSSNAGLSGIVSSSGKILQRSALQTEGIVFGNVSVLSSQTLYSQLGDWLVYLSAAGLLAFGSWTLLHRVSLLAKRESYTLGGGGTTPCKP